MQSTITTDATSTLGQRVYSSAIDRIAVTQADLPGTYNAIVWFHSNPTKGYRYAFEDDATAYRWIELLANDQDPDAVPFSWGRELNRALKHGDIEPIEV
jgi:hypothetical protein